MGPRGGTTQVCEIQPERRAGLRLPTVQIQGHAKKQSHSLETGTAALQPREELEPQGCSEGPWAHWQRVWVVVSSEAELGYYEFLVSSGHRKQYQVARKIIQEDSRLLNNESTTLSIVTYFFRVVVIYLFRVVDQLEFCLCLNL